MDLHFMFRRTDHKERGTVEPPPKCRRKLPAAEELTGDPILRATSRVDRNICNTTNLCHLLSADDEPKAIDNTINAGKVPQLVEFLKMDTCSELQLKAAWALTNIASGTSEHTKVVVDGGAVPILVKLLSSCDVGVCEQATWALGNIAGDSTKYRDVVLDHDAFTLVLLPLCGNYPYELTLKQKSSMALKNLCRGKPRPTFEKMEHALMALSNAVQTSTDVQILTNVCWAVSHIMEGSEAEYKAVAKCDLMLHFMKFTKEGNPPLLAYAALHALGSLLDCDTDDIDRMSSAPYCAEMAKFICNGGLGFVHDVLKRDNEECKIEACWIVSRCTASSYDTIQAVIDNNIIETLVNLLRLGGLLAVRKNAVLALKFVAIGGARDQIRHLLDNGCVEALLDAMNDDEEMLLDCVISQYHMLNSFERLFKKKFEAAEGWRRRQFLSVHPNSKIQEAVEMFKNIWCRAVEIQEAVLDGGGGGGGWEEWEDLDSDVNDGTGNVDDTGIVDGMDDIN